MASVVFASFVAKATRKVLRLFGKGATTLPGKLALKINPTIIRKLSVDKDIITVTGTNGKTTTTHMIVEMLSNIGFDVVTNISGANLASGIATTLICGGDEIIKAQGGSKQKTKTVYVLETDEAAFAKIAGDLQPKVSVVSNLFRDQLDRYGELTYTRDCISNGIDKNDAKLVINADDSLVASLGKGREGRTIFFGMELASMKSNNVTHPENKGVLPASPDAVYCPLCNVRYEYEARSFSHLGAFCCPKCGARRPSPRFEVVYSLSKSPSDPDYGYIIKDTTINEANEIILKVPGSHNLYNSCAAVAAVSAYLEEGNDKKECFDTACKAALSVKAAFGRMEKFSVGDGNKQICILLVKNPAGLDRSLSFLANAKDADSLFFLLNSNIADGKDVSWIWDVDFESKIDNLPKRIYVSGERWADMQLRVHYAGGRIDKADCMEKAKEILDRAIEACEPNKCVYILPNYTSMLALRAILVKQYGLKDFWK